MQPRCWYARSDLGHLARLSQSEIVGVRLFSHGYLTRRRNPEFKRKGVPGSTKLTAGTEQPHHLYTLTPAGEQAIIGTHFLSRTRKDRYGRHVLLYRDDAVSWRALHLVYSVELVAIR
jgi:hypothetical protein